jgi:methyl-accepting chemotaxis protein
MMGSEGFVLVVMVVIILIAVVLAIRVAGLQTVRRTIAGTATFPDEVHQVRKELDALREELREMREAATGRTSQLDRSMEQLTERISRVEAKKEDAGDVEQRLGGEG